jgi:subtilase family serine protease
MMTKRLPVSAGVSVVLLLVTVFASYGAGKRHFIRGNTPPAVKRLRAIENLSATNQLHLAIALPLRNQAELDALLKTIYDPASASYHHYLTPAQFAEKFGPTKSDYQALIKFAERNGLKVTGTHPNRVVLDVAGSVADIENTFQVKMRVYNHPKEKRTFYSPDTEPSVDASVQIPILSISGLNNYSLPQPAGLHITSSNQPPGSPTQAGSGTGGSYRGLDFRAAYVPKCLLNGSGQSVALLEFDGYYSNDIAQYEKVSSLPYTTLITVPVDGGVSSDPGSGNGVLEVSLDIEMAVAMATNLSSVLVYEEPEAIYNWPDILSQIADDDLAAQISCSWYNPNSPGPEPASEQIFQQMAAQGQSFFCASGDNDAFVGEVPFPDDSPDITMVGGTTLVTTGPVGVRVSESAWNDGGGTGTGGGISTYYSIPSWQSGINTFLTNGGSTLARNVPDVALTANNIYVKYGNGLSSSSVEGTSCAAPLWAGFMALANQQAVAGGKPTVGFINPAIYEIANESIYSIAFNDITKGTNTWSLSPNSFFAVPGYDLCTGLGTPKGTNLINALVSPDPFLVVSNAGINFVVSPDGTFNPASQTYYLTNVGTSSLDWAMMNTSVWMNVSNGGGTLAAGASDSVVVSLNPVAANLTAGSYSASLWFSNVTSKVGHSRFFTLNVNDPLVILPQKFLFSGPSGGPFVPGSLGVILTNASAGALNWGINNTSVWFNVSATNGSLSPGTQISVAFSLSPAAASLPDGFYNAVFQVTNLASQFVQMATGVVTVGIIQNGGFETGDFSDWTLAGDANTGSYIYDAVVTTNAPLGDGSGPNFIHSGSYGAFLGDTNLAFLSQTIPTTPGQSYTLSFWLVNPQSGAGQQFLVNWNTNSASTNQIYLVNNPGTLAWKKVTFVVKATDTNATLQFGAENPPDGFGLDDVSLVAISPPVFTAQPPTNLTVLAGSTVVLNASASGSAPLTYQWRTNGANLVDGGGISGSATNNLTLTSVTTNSTANYSVVVTNAYGSITSSVTALTVVLPPGINGVAANPNGSVTLSLSGSPGVSYVLESTTNFVSGSGWQPVATNVFDVTGAWQFNDMSAASFPQRFYRLKYTQ